MEMPKPTEHHKQLEALAGSWVGDETMFPSPWDPKGGKAVARCTFRMELDGFFLVGDYTQERDGRVNYRAHGVFGYDGPEQRYTMHWFDSVGMVPQAPARGSWDGDTLTFEHRTPMGHARYRYQLTGPGAYLFRMDSSQDGREWKPFVEGKFTRA